MTRVEAIEASVRSLSKEELADFRQWFAEFDAQAWDSAIEDHVREGRLEGLAARALEQHRSGKTREL